jgi:hypothetical protein
MRSLLISWLSFQFLIPAFVAGYKIDQSCEDKGIAKNIRDAMTSAFERASDAYTTLTSPPLSADALELLGFLFTKDGANPAELISQGKLEKTIGVLQGINTNMRNEVTGDASVRPEDVVRTMATKAPKDHDRTDCCSRSYTAITTAGSPWKERWIFGKIPVCDAKLLRNHTLTAYSKRSQTEFPRAGL